MPHLSPNTPVLDGRLLPEVELGPLREKATQRRFTETPGHGVDPRQRPEHLSQTHPAGTIRRTMLVRRRARGRRRRGRAAGVLEVSNINALAISASLRMGFAFCVLDTRLHGGTESAGEQARAPPGRGRASFGAGRADQM